MNWYYKRDNQVVGPLSGESMKELRGCGLLFDDSQVCEEGSETWVRYCEVFERELLQTALPAQIENPETQSKPYHSNSPHVATNSVEDGPPMSPSYGNDREATYTSKSANPFRGKPKNRKRLILGALAFVIFLVIAFRTKSPDLDDPKAVAKIATEAVEFKKLQSRDHSGKKTLYLPNTDSPYTGWVKTTDGEILKKLAHAKNGLSDGPYVGYYHSGQKLIQGTAEKGLRNGKQLNWYQNGQKEIEITFNDDLIETVVVWKPNGEKCQSTSVTNGNGHYCFYDDDGRLTSKATVKNGKKDP